MNPRMIVFYGALVCYSGAIVCYYANQLEGMLILVVLGVMNMCRWSGLRKQEYKRN